MADEIREYLKAAQAAELRGEKALAAQLLTRVASLYRSAGKEERAQQMLRQAQRLGDGGPEPDEALRRLDGGPAAPVAPEPEPAPPPSPREAALIERGPTLADPLLEAWCSFCCRPTGEVGRLVAGPAGAFICLTCLRDSARLLGAEVGRETAGPAVAPAVDGARPVPVELVGQDEATRVLDAAMQAGLGWILLVGPEGSGKTTWLRQLARQGLGHHASGADGLPAEPVRRRLLLDGLDRLDAGQLAEVCSRAERLGVQVVLALRGGEGRAVGPSLALKGAGMALSVLSTEAVEAVSCGRLPREIAERIQAVACFQAQGPELLVEVARRIAAARVPALSLSDEALRALARAAARSPRGGHELSALIGRIPAGAWELEARPRSPGRTARGGGRKGGR